MAKRTSAAAVLLGLAVVGLYLSGRHLPSLNEPPPRPGTGLEGQNFFGQGISACYANSVLLLIGIYGVKRCLLTRFTKRWAILLFSSFAAVTVPYIWFLCEPDWFNPFIYRVACWIGNPIAVWFVPTVSFAVDLCSERPVASTTRYLIRSGLEIFLAVPVWIIAWAYFSFFGLGWGWI